MADTVWRSESDAPAPTRVVTVDDRLNAAAAVKRAKDAHLLYAGDFRNAKQLIAAMGRQLEKGRPPRHATPLDAFRHERGQRLREAETVSRVIVQLDRDYRLEHLKHAPDVAEACRHAWGPSDQPTQVPLKALLGLLGAEQWRAKGVAVPGLEGRVHPDYGVFLPTRTEYVGLVANAPAPKGKRVFDVGTGTGVLSFLLLQRGAAHAVGTDIDARAVACATANARRLGLADRFEAQERSLFPEGRADLVVANPPWIPEPPKTRLDRAVFDPDNAFLEGFLAGLPAHLSKGGEGWLLLSNFAELLGLRPAGFLDERLARAGLKVAWSAQAPAAHGKAKDAADPLHAVRSKEVTTLFALVTAV